MPYNDTATEPPEKKTKIQCSPKVTLSLWEIHGLDEKVPIHIPNLPTALRENRQNIADFFLFVYERQRIWERRNRDEAQPWSQNPVFLDCSFCNNYRELDRGTQFFHAHVLDLRDSMGPNVSKLDWLTAVLWASYVYRQVNKVESFLQLGFPAPRDAVSFLKRASSQFKEKGCSFFTGAHQTQGYVNYRRHVEAVARNDGKLLREVSKKISNASNTKLCLKHLRAFPGIGQFLAWQMLCDLRESYCIDAKVDDYCELGPGAINGVRDIFRNVRGLNVTNRNLSLARSLVQYQRDVYDALQLSFPYWRGRCLTIKEIEHALCEYSKFKRVQNLSFTNKVALRRYTSRSGLDLHANCFQCKGGCERAGCFCDTCNNFVCSNCMICPEQELSFICKRCRDLEVILSRKSDAGV